MTWRRLLTVVAASAWFAAGCGESPLPASDSGTPDAVVVVVDTGTVRKVDIPVFSPQGGIFTTAQDVAITSATSAASIYFTVDGTVPTAGSNKYQSKVPIAKDTTLRAIALLDGYTPSDVQTATYKINIEVKVPQAIAPTISPAGGTFASPQTVTLATTEPAASIYFTTNGTLASKANGTLYSIPFQVSTSSVIIAVATAANKLDSSPANAPFVIEPPALGTAPAPSISPPSGEYEADVTVALASTVSDATICYTTDSTAPGCDTTQPIDLMCTGSSTRYVSSLQPVVASAKTVKALTCKIGLKNSAESSTSYTFRAGAPTVTAGSGAVLWGTKPMANSATAGATILVTKTIDGSTPADPDVIAGTCSAFPGVSSSTLPEDISKTGLTGSALPSQGNNGLKRNAKFKLRACKLGYALSPVVNLDYAVQLSQPKLYSNSTMLASEEVAIGAASSKLDLYFRSGAATAANTDGAGDVGALCVAASGKTPACGADMKSCVAQGTDITTFLNGAISDLLPATVTGSTSYAVWDGASANDYNLSEKKDFSVIACRPGTTPSTILTGQWSWQLKPFGYYADGQGTFQTPLNPQPASIALGVDLASHAAGAGVPHVGFGLWKTNAVTGATYAAITATGASLVDALSAELPVSITFYFTTDGTDPAVPSTCGAAATAGTTQRAEISSSSFNMTGTLFHSLGGETIKVIACAPSMTNSAIATLSVAVPGTPPAPTISPAAGTYAAPFDSLAATPTYVTITRGAADTSDNICYTTGGTDPVCNTATNCTTGIAVKWNSNSSTIVFDSSVGGAATEYEIGGVPAANLGFVSDNVSGNLRVRACKAGAPMSTVTSQAFTFKVPNPTPAADGALPQGAPSVLDPDDVLKHDGTVLTGTTWEWRFTTDGSAPNCASTLWTSTTPNAHAAIIYGANLPATVKVIGCRANWTASDVVTRTYTTLMSPAPQIYAGTVGTTTSQTGIATRADGSYSDQVTVVIRTSATDATLDNSVPNRSICYTTDGTAPSCGLTYDTCVNGSNLSDTANVPLASTLGGIQPLQSGPRTIRAVTCSSGGYFNGIITSAETSKTFAAVTSAPTLALTSPPAALLANMRVVGLSWPADASALPTRTTAMDYLFSFDSLPATCNAAVKTTAALAVTTSDVQKIPVPKDGTLYVRACKTSMQSTTSTIAVSGMSPYSKSITAWSDWSTENSENAFNTGVGSHLASEFYVSYDATTLYLGLDRRGGLATQNLTYSDEWAYWLLSAGTPTTAAAATGAPFPVTVSGNFTSAGATNSNINGARWIAMVSGTGVKGFFEWSGTAWVSDTTGVTVLAGGASRYGLAIPRARLGSASALYAVPAFYDPDDGNDNSPTNPYDSYGFATAGARDHYIDFNAQGWPAYVGSSPAGVLPAPQTQTLASSNVGRACWSTANVGTVTADGRYSAYCP